MAILETIRRRPGLMVGFIGVALAAFVIGDGLQNGNTWFSANQRVVLSVDGEEISIDDYEKRYQMLTEQMQQQSGGQISDEQRMNLNNSLAQQFIADQILHKLAKQVGVRVTPDEVFALLHSGQGVTPSPLAQQFFSGLGIDVNDSKAVNDFITQISEEKIKSLPAEQQTIYRRIQLQWQSLQDQIVTNRLQQKLSALLSRSYKVTQLDQDLAVAGGLRTVAVVRTTPLEGTDKNDKPSDDEIKKYYEERKSLFVMQSPSADVSYISTQVVPSSEDYKAAEVKANKAYADLQAATTNISSVVRNLGGSLNETYLTGEELNQLGLGDAEVEFIKSAGVGEVHNSGLVNEKYSLIKLVAKKSAPEALGVQLIALDSVTSQKADSLLMAIKGGANFEEMVTKYSQDPQTKANGGRLSQEGQYGMTSDSFTEAQLAGSLLADVFTKPAGEAYIANSGAMKLIVRSVDVKPAVEKYQLAVVNVEATFSDKTYTAKYDAINRILGAGGSFEDMSKKAEKEGFTVVKSESVNTSSPQLGMLPSSRSVIQWALNADDDTLTDKVYRLGTDYLVIAKVNKHYEAGTAPLSVVKSNIVAALSAEKRAKNLAEATAKKGLNSLEAYASEFNAQIDTIRDVNYFVRGSEPAIFNGKAMTTAIGQISKPFAAGTEVMVVRPTATAAPNKEAIAAEARQAEQGLGYQLVSRSFQNLLQKSKVEDNRARFY